MKKKKKIENERRDAEEKKTDLRGEGKKRSEGSEGNKSTL